ncbi:phage tail assembly protein [Pararhodospirillum photometricum]|uniref:Phage tail E family protein n=1 Tax=Pararhodospirillum photometricum DSM 122 TaxID=1150469 RepID=H6SQI8_PARPM|nr:phage tail assembly protein [Pararhodospirillum photometricum]CCG09707.1 Phage tail E family protein [Pararhodospirillum photometricum DSM 122]
MTNTNTVTVKFKVPLPYGDALLEELTLRKPKAGDLRGLKMSGLIELDVDTILKIVPRIASPHVVEAQLWELEADDLARLSNGVVGFFQ